MGLNLLFFQIAIEVGKCVLSNHCLVLDLFYFWSVTETGLDYDLSIVSRFFKVDLFGYVCDLVNGLVLDLPFVLAFF